MSTDKNHKKALKEYVNGSLSNKEQHTLEKTSLDDPFLEEAIEGATTIKASFSKDIEYLENKISKKKKSILRLKIAASLLAVLTLSIIVWYSSKPFSSSEKTLAVKENVVGTKVPEKKSYAAEDMGASSEEDLSKINEVVPIKQTKENGNAKDRRTDTTPQVIPQEAIAEASTDKIPIKVKNSDPHDASLDLDQSIAIADYSEVEESNTLDGTSETAMLKSARMSTLPSSKSEELIEVELDVEVTEESVVENVVFEEFSEETNQYATIGMEPVIGWEKYNTYLADSLRYPTGLKRQAVHGRVFVQAIFDEKGEVQEAMVIKGINDQCDQEALRLVKEGPKFIPDSKGRKGKVIVSVKF